ncbi:MAG: ABC transporter ATP-binding protein [SAR86 cluster bacterium]|jgi:iron(III) transport system ATP-binding protein|nr:ABC transporter ATP-binding protein [SAR86 cluster bacterium]
MSLLISNLSYKRKNEENLLHDINFEIDNGHLLVIQGESGCGKTTLLNIISGLLKPTDGLIKLNSNVLNSSEKFIAPEKRKIGYVFQDYALFPHLTAHKNATYAYKNNYMELTDEYVLNALNLKSHTDKYPHELSGGQQQRVAIARAILMHPQALIFDEPFSGLDKENIVETQNLIQDAIRVLNIPGIIVTHSLEHLQDIDTRMIVKI